jgi:uncharacterized Ntn-hydrolase superfamily protein
MRPDSPEASSPLRISTFSIVAFDARGPAWGIAVASKFPAVGAVVPWALAGSGAVATQSYANTTYGPRGLERMGAGKSAEETLGELTAGDDDRATRQVGLVDAQGGAATFTGDKCHDWAGGLTGDGFAIQGNILVGPEVVEAMAKSFEGTQGDLPERLMVALLAGDRAGGDRRGRQSAALLVVKAGGGYAGLNDRWIDYRVDDHEDPVPELIKLLELHRLYFEESPPEDRVDIRGEVAEELQAMMARLGYYPGAVTGELDSATRKALEAFIGAENFEDRADLDNGKIDRPVYEYLRRKFKA